MVIDYPGPDNAGYTGQPPDEAAAGHRVGSPAPQQVVRSFRITPVQFMNADFFFHGIPLNFPVFHG